MELMPSTGGARDEREPYTTRPDPTTESVEIRCASRLLLIDEGGHVLLFKQSINGVPFWGTPGGGVELGETWEETARREAAEELGAKQVELVQLWSDHSDRTFRGKTVCQTETFFLVTRHSGILGAAVKEVHEKEGILEVRWWSPSSTETSHEPLYPADLADKLRRHLPLGAVTRAPSSLW
jgi:ADP-ribose pyrophosphatase YjhB (NUDIX family)